MVDHYYITFDIKNPTIDAKILQKLNKVKTEMEREFDYQYEYTEYINEANSKQVKKFLRTMKLKQDIHIIVSEDNSIDLITKSRIAIENIKQIEKIMGLVVGRIEYFKHKEQLVMGLITQKDYDGIFCNYKNEVKPESEKENTSEPIQDVWSEMKSPKQRGVGF